MPETSPVGAASGDPTKDFFTAANEQTYAGMSEATLNATHATIAKNLKRVEDAMASYTKNPTESQQKNISKYRTLSNDMTRELAIIESVAADKSRVKKQTQEAEAAGVTARARESVQSEFKTKEDATKIASMEDTLRKRGMSVDLPDNLTAAEKEYNDLVVTDPNSAANAQRKAEAAKTRAGYQQTLEAQKQAGRKEMESLRNQHKQPEIAAKAVQDALNNQEGTMKMLFDEYKTLKTLREKNLIAEDDPDLAAAWGNYEAAKAKYLGMASDAPAAAPVAAPVASGDPMSKAEEEYNALPDDQKTPEAAARIAAKYGIK